MGSFGSMHGEGDGFDSLRAGNSRPVEWDQGAQSLEVVQGGTPVTGDKRKECQVDGADLRLLEGKSLNLRPSAFYSNPYPYKEVQLNNPHIAFGSLTNSELKKKGMLFGLMSNPLTSNLGQKFLPILSKIPVLRLIPKATIFSNFCGGEDIVSAIENGKNFHTRSKGIFSILDFAVEGEKTEAGFEATTNELLRCIRAAATESHISFCAVKITGIGDFALLEKKQNGDVLSKAEEVAFRKIEDRLDGICAAAAKGNVKVFIDAEESWVQDVIDNLTVSMMKKYNSEKPIVYTTVQLYRSDRLQYLAGLIDNAKEEGYILALKTVRGAYLEKENKWAIEHGVQSVIQPDKNATDLDYDRAVELCLDNLEHVSLFVASHNATSCQKAIRIMAQRGIQPDCERVHFGQLLGMSDPLSFGLRNAGFNVSKYVPYGPLQAVVPYLLRRAKENTSIAGQTSREFEAVRTEIRYRKSGSN